MEQPTPWSTDSMVPLRASAQESVVWTTDLVVRRSVIAHLPHLLLADMLVMANLVRGNEFSLFLKFETNDNHDFFITDWYAPKQKVDSANVDYENEVRPDGFNGVIHRHPVGCRNFSPTDWRFLNSQMDLSILYIPPMDFPQAVTRVPLGKQFFYLPVEVEIQTTEHIQTMLKQIKVQQFVPSQSRSGAVLNEEIEAAIASVRRFRSTGDHPEDSADSVDRLYEKWGENGEYLDWLH